MADGVFEGKKAKEYEKRVLSSDRVKETDKFVLNNVKGQNLKIVDLGCGAGNTMELLLKRSKEMVGVEASKTMVDICKKKFKKNKKVKLVLSSVTNVPVLKADYFDVVILRMSLHHIKEKKKVLGEVKRVLKKNGKFILIDQYYLNWFNYYFREIFVLIFKFDTHLLDHYMLSEEENVNLLKDFKFVKKENCPWITRVISQSFRWVLKK